VSPAGPAPIIIAFFIYGLLFVRFKQEEFTGKEIPEENNHRGNDFGNHIMDAQFVGTDIHDEGVEPQTNNSNNGKHDKFRPAVSHRPVIENPRDAEQVIGNQAQDKGDGGGKEVMHSKNLGKQNQHAVVNQKCGTTYKTIPEQLYQHIVSFTLKDFFEPISHNIN
jgi:hypothetical protein